MSNGDSFVALDTETLWDRVDGDVELLKEIIDIYFAEAPGLLTQMCQAVEQGACDDLSRVAHRFKGMVGNLAAEGAFRVAIRLESAARENELDAAKSCLRELEGQLQLLESALSRLAAGETSCAS